MLGDGQRRLTVAVEIKLTGEFDADGHADEHREPGLLGEQRGEPQPCALRIFGEGFADLAGVVGAAPAALGEGVDEDPQQSRRGLGDEPFGSVEAARLGQGLERGFELGLGHVVAWHLCRS